MWMKNFVTPNLQWIKHHSRHRSSGDRVSSKHRQQSRVIEEDREQIGDMVPEEGKEIRFMVVKEEEKETEVMEAEEEGKETEVMASEEEERKDVGAMSDAKTWNFRPRNPIRRSLNLNGINFGFGRLMVTPKCPSLKKPEVENKKESVKKKDQNKRCLAAILTKEEIKEDWRQWAQLGIRPPKKHIKRPKCVQKQVDDPFVLQNINLKE